MDFGINIKSDTKHWTAKIAARKEGAIGQLGAEHRTYEFTAATQGEAVQEAIRLAYADGLEHVTVTRLIEKSN